MGSYIKEDNGCFRVYKIRLLIFHFALILALTYLKNLDSWKETKTVKFRLIVVKKRKVLWWICYAIKSLDFITDT